MKAFLIIRLGSLGDVIHGIPTAAALRERFPDARIDWMVDPRYVELLDLVEGIDRCIPFDPRDLTRGVHAWSVLGELRRTRYDAVIDLQGPLYSVRQMAEALGRCLGKPLQVVDVPPAAHVGALTSAGLPAEVATALAEMFAFAASGRITVRGDRTERGTTAVDEALRAALGR